MYGGEIGKYLGQEFLTEVQTFEWLKLASHRRLPRGVFAEWSISDSHPVAFVRDEMILRLSAEVLGRKRGTKKFEDTKTLSVKVPRSTWQMFKMRNAGSWWLGWLVARRPVQYDVVEKTARFQVVVNEWEIFPEQERVHPQMGRTIQIPVYHTNPIRWSECV